jgi:uncharacterized protein YecT (DUF1311 family)
MKYCFLIFAIIGGYTHAGEIEACYAITGGAAWVRSCVQSLAIEEKRHYETVFSEFLKNEHRQPESLNNPKEFLHAIKVAKKAWDTVTEADCKAEGLRNIKDSFADHTDKNDCLYHAYRRRIQYYQDYD